MIEVTAEDIANGCNCNDQYKTGPCPVHSKILELSSKTVVTDKDLVSGKYRRWEGLTFTCPKCGMESIMYMQKFCGNCGTAVQIESKELTEAINAFMLKNRR